ncbi:AGAP005213-PA [Anopheles gambiae str. PEST]|uniref:AGAP005213-PA n=1 Tax=Anopheles gambiae TaxID=7165 RepID=Q7PQ16_ANOGA|nr:AGAP005213-PA [Anopheles gambiae str. PEST]
MDWSTGDLVWFDPGLGHPLPGEIQEVHRAAQMIIVQALINGKPQTFTLGPNEGNIRARQDLGKTGVEDMTQLEDLHEASLLWNLKLRYDNGLIYTNAGSILIAINPYKMFPESYGIEMAKLYSGRPLGTLPPHLFAIGSAAHAALPSPQVVVISGESGSGKTESTKLVMQYLAAVVPGGGSASTVITEQILEAAPLLEAFGNARTVRNDNSSRFGKYLEVYFKSGAIIGAKITQYLLEKSRIVTQAAGERNYHVFYELLGGLAEPERMKYGLLEADKYFYLNQGGSDCAPGRMDWASLQSAMQVLGVTESEREGIVKVLASVLHLGNVYFHRRQLRHGQEGVEIGSDAEIKWAAHLLQLPSEGILKSLTSRITETRSERLYTPLGIDQALDARDALAKALYSGLFNWLVLRINSIVHRGGTHDAQRLSILDIFGFEDLAENSFEQLCINYANESLQLYFNKHVFKLEQAEYARERLEWTNLEWEDNLPVIHLLAKKPVGIFHLLDDESNFPRANDSSFLEKCHYNHALNELYSRPRVGAQEFGITHYAGQVWYCVDGFLEKNRDALRMDVIELLSSSTEPLVGEMTKQLRAQRDVGKTLPKGSNGRFVTMKPRTPTVAARFSDSLQQLLQSMAKCNPWFVRCVKPNNDKQALRMDMPCVLQQLRYLGMLDTIKIRQSGYPVRLRFQHFVERYRHLMRTPLPKGTPYRELCRFVLDELPGTTTEGPDFQLGATRVFLREALHRTLEASRADRLRLAAVTIQRTVRGMLARKKVQREVRGAVTIQRYWRGYRDRNRYLTIKNGVVKYQALYKGHMQRKRYAKLKNELKRRREAERLKKERTAQRLAKEQVERGSAVPLDIPAELAFIFSKSENWSGQQSDRNLVKVVGTVPGPPSAADLPPDLDQFAFGKFSSVYCNGVKLAPRRDIISAPFLSRAAARDQDFKDAIAIFKLIIRWTTDATMDANREKILADYIVHKGLSSRGLRDEILVQICNQVYRADEAAAEKLWTLMSHCLSAFQPGSAFSKYLIKFIVDNAPPNTKEQILKKLLRNANAGQTNPCRLFPPAWLEWRASSRLADTALGLNLPDNSVQTVAVDSWTTCEEAAALAISSFGIPNLGWTVVIDESDQMTDSCGLDFVLDLVAEKELPPAFPAVRSDILRCGRKDPFEVRPFLDPYGRAKTVRIGKWRWPPPQGVTASTETEETFIQFKMTRQSNRKTTPQSQHSSSNLDSPIGSPNGVEWEEFEIDQKLQEQAAREADAGGKGAGGGGQQPGGAARTAKRSFDIGADRPAPNSVGKLKLSNEMRQRLEQVTAGHSVRSSSAKSDRPERTPAKLEDTRRMMLEQQLGGMNPPGGAKSPGGDAVPSVKTQVQRMEASKKGAPATAWPTVSVLPPAPPGPAPPPPIRPPTSTPPAPPPPIHGNMMAAQNAHQQNQSEIPSFVQRQERDTFGAKDSFMDSWGRAEAAKLDLVYETSFKKEMIIERERSRSRSRSRDRENFSESVWDRSEVEGPSSTSSDPRDRDRGDKEREARERNYELTQLQREKESNKVFHPSSYTKDKQQQQHHQQHHQQHQQQQQQQSQYQQQYQQQQKQYSANAPGSGIATFKTHMVQKSVQERERKSSAATTNGSVYSEKLDDGAMADPPAPVLPVQMNPSLKAPAAACLTYNRVTWTLRVRKEVFRPSETVTAPAALDLLFNQITADVFGVTPCMRISPQEKRLAVNLLSSHGITANGHSTAKQHVRAIVKRHVLDMARGWPLYFARLFVMNGSPSIQEGTLLAVSHMGVYLASKEPEFLSIQRAIPFDDIQSVTTLPRPLTLQLTLKTGARLVMHASKANAIQVMVQSYLAEYRQTQSKGSTISSGVRAAAATLNVPLERLETSNVNSPGSPNQMSPTDKGHHLHHMMGGHPGQHQSPHHLHHLHHQQQQQLMDEFEDMHIDHGGLADSSPPPTMMGGPTDGGMAGRAGSGGGTGSGMIVNHKGSPMGNGNGNYSDMHIVAGGHHENDSSPTQTSLTKHSLLQFAMQHFRTDDEFKSNRSDKRAMRNQHADLVKWQGYPLRAPLLRLPADLTPLALECFDCVLRYCGDLAVDPELSEVKCVYTVLMHCHKHLALRDEVYCQLMKQTTANRSACPDSAQRAWRLLSILAAYFGCSDALRPYLIEHLTSAASDRRRPCHGTAAVCLTNLRKTARCGGRKNVPSVEEVTAVSAGRSARRQIYRLPGGAERIVNTRCSTVVGDVIAELCSLLGIESPAEQQEFSLYCIVQGDAFTMPLAADEYILDVTTELLKSGQPFYLIFCRSVWHFALKRDPAPTPLYIEVLFNQVAPDYLEGLLLELPNGGAPSPDYVRDMARIAAILHRAADLNHLPAMKEIKFLLPKPALSLRELRPAQWVALVQSAWPSVAGLSPIQVKAQFLNVLSSWPLFGSSFFAVKRVWADENPMEEPSPMWRELILALNRRGVLFLDPNTHETMQHWPFNEVISTRKVRSEDGALFLDMKVGNLLQQRVIRVQTEQAHEISRLVRQYITMAQAQQRDRRE